MYPQTRCGKRHDGLTLYEFNLRLKIKHRRLLSGISGIEVGIVFRFYQELRPCGIGRRGHEIIYHDHQKGNEEYYENQQAALEQQVNIVF